MPAALANLLMACSERCTTRGNCDRRKMLLRKTTWFVQDAKEQVRKALLGYQAHAVMERLLSERNEVQAARERD